jgi:LDH2 family malate/lactate/ureidoglycolate dehydrogenase
MAKGLRTAAGFSEVLLPGEPEHRLWIKRRAQGIPLFRTTVEELDGYAQQFSISFPPSPSTLTPFTT